MTLLQKSGLDAVQTVAELERRLQASLAERDEALAQSAAMAEVLQVINAASGDPAPVLDAILAHAMRLCDAAFGILNTYDGETFHTAAVRGVPDKFAEFRRASPPAYGPGTPPARLVAGEPFVHVADIMAEEPFRQGETNLRAIVELGGARSVLAVPLLKDGSVVGMFALYRQQVRPFSERQIAVLQGFAAQASLALQNARLFNETRRALERQTATADILKVIASSPSDVQPVFSAIAYSANRLIGGFSTAVFRFIDGIAHLAAFTPTNPAADEVLKARFPRPIKGYASFDLVRDGEPVQIADTESSPDLRDIAQARGYRSMLFTPLVSAGAVIGMVSVTRKETGSFAADHVELLRTFADQAVIAIENVRLFDEVQARTRELSESLQQQTATADVLKVISRSAFDLQTVLDTLVQSAAQLCTTKNAFLYLREGESYVLASNFGFSPEVEQFFRAHPIPPGKGTLVGRTALTGRVVHLHDVTEDPDFTWHEGPRHGGFRTMLGIPLMREGQTIGVFALTRAEPDPFAPAQIELVQTFADQAVIAIENARLFGEVQARTAELSESLQQQTATAEVLKVISRSTFDLQTVLETLITSAVELSGAGRGSIFLRDGDVFPLKAASSTTPEFIRYWTEHPATAGRGSATSRVIASGKIEMIEDTLADPEMQMPADSLASIRGTLGVPLLRDNKVEGVLVLTRPEPGPFSRSQIDLVQTFADQAVIAVENVRLFDEIQARTKELSESLQVQTATSEVLKVISRSPDALQPVLDVIVQTSRELCGADASTIFLLRDGKFHVTAVAGQLPVHLDAMRANPLAADDPSSVLGRMARDKRTQHYPNVFDDPELRAGIGGLGGPRALLTVPLMRDGEVIGGITLRRAADKSFSPRQVEAIEAFADQAVIAISNVGLFEQVQARTAELSRSLDELRTAQDRLVQTEKLASLGQLTAGIAHEIKNPLNFVNNFAALSSELVDELKETLAPSSLDNKTRAEVDELSQMLQDNLSKVVQHGRRADSIVKNMLLHSREGSGERRPADINAIVEESLNLSYHGARAENSGFNIELARDLDPDAGLVDLYPQEITRVFLNLISNGFYAATRRKAAAGDGFEPKLSASTRNFGDSVEIRIRDNGTGIPPEVREKMFNPFFTTKPAGEGTGLGLSMSHDIVVKQHGGTIGVDTRLGEFTEFIITLPRGAAANIHAGGTN